jgi:hypothetical protein
MKPAIKPVTSQMIRPVTLNAAARTIVAKAILPMHRQTFFTSKTFSLRDDRMYLCTFAIFDTVEIAQRVQHGSYTLPLIHDSR